MSLQPRHKRARQPRAFHPEAGALEARALLSGATGQAAAIAFVEGGVQRIQSYENGANGHLLVNYLSGSQWLWGDIGPATPLNTSLNTTLVGKPSVVSFSQGGKQLVYAFDTGANGHMELAYWDGTGPKWKWYDLKTPKGTSVAGDPSAITFVQGNSRAVQAYVRGADGHLDVVYWSGSGWLWGDIGTPGTSVTGDPSTVSYAKGNTQLIYSFVRGTDGHLDLAYWDGTGPKPKWKWYDLKTPKGMYLDSSPSAVTYAQGRAQQFSIYARVSDGSTGPGFFPRLYVARWDGSQWPWSDRGIPDVGQDKYQFIASAPSAVSFPVQGVQHEFAFVRGSVGNLDVNYGSGNQWLWDNRGTPNASLSGDPSAITSLNKGVQQIYVFDNDVNGHLQIHYYDGKKWQPWIDAGLPPKTTL
jgi:hypothetical protein